MELRNSRNQKNEKQDENDSYDELDRDKRDGAEYRNKRVFHNDPLSSKELVDAYKFLSNGRKALVCYKIILTSL